MLKKTLSRLILVTAWILGPGGARLSAAFSFVTIDHPLAGAGGTMPNDVEAGRIVGTYLDTSAVSHGFIFDGVSWNTLDHPAASAPRGTEGFGISEGLVCGTFVDASGRTFGFLYADGTWTTLERPPLGLGPVDTFARGISEGTVVGYSIESLVARGFIYRDGVFTDLAIPGSTGTFPRDIDQGRIVGNFDDLVSTHGFLYQGGVVEVLDYPFEPVLGTFVRGIDGTNVVGNYVSLVDGHSHGFLFDGTTYVPIDVPGSMDTAATGIDGTRIVGTYTDAAGAPHGFVTTIPEPSSAVASVLALGLLLRRPKHTNPHRLSSTLARVRSGERLVMAQDDK
jgi:hypothetical protein